MVSDRSQVIMLILTWMLISSSQGREFKVGGGNNLWKVPLPSPDSLSQWATTIRFRVGDSIVFEYDNTTESVHVVNKDDYLKCNTKGEEHDVFNDGSTELVFTSAGEHHFISGIKKHCKLGLKLSLLVISNKRSRSQIAPSPLPLPPSPSPSPLLSAASPPPLLPPPPPSSKVPSPLLPPTSASPSPLPSSSSTSPSPFLAPQSSGGQGAADGNAGFIVWSGVSMAIMYGMGFLI